VEDLFCRQSSLKDGLRGKEGAYTEMRIELLSVGHTIRTEVDLLGGFVAESAVG
jgi:hypothetical protein